MLRFAHTIALLYAWIVGGGTAIVIIVIAIRTLADSMRERKRARVDASPAQESEETSEQESQQKSEQAGPEGDRDAE